MPGGTESHAGCEACCCSKPLTFIAFLCLGSASWLTVNSVFAEMPLIAAVVPEGWQLAAELGFAIQVANVFAVMYLFFRRCCVKRAAAVVVAQAARQRQKHGDSLFESLIRSSSVKSHEKFSGVEIRPPHSSREQASGGALAVVDGAEAASGALAASSEHTAEHTPASYATPTRAESRLLAAEAKASLQLTALAILVVLGGGMIATVLLAFVWSATVGDPGHSWSLPLLSLAFVAGAVDCVSTVTFWPFASRFPLQMTTALAVGEGLSGMLPGLLALPQAAQLQQTQSVANVSFGVTEFLLCMVVVLLIATLAFIFLFIQTMRDPVSLRKQKATPGVAQSASKASAASSEGVGVAGAGDSDRAAFTEALTDLDTDAKAGTYDSTSSATGSADRCSHTRTLAAAPTAITISTADSPTELQSGDNTTRGTIRHIWSLLRRHAILLGLIVCLSFVQNGAMVAILPYAAAPLDPRSPDSGRHWQQLLSSNPGIVLQWTNTCGLLADPLGALLTLLPACQRAPLVRSSLLVCVWVVALLVVLGLALAGPYAQWGGSEGAAIMLAAVYTAARFAMGLQRAQLFLVARSGGFGGLHASEVSSAALHAGGVVDDWPKARPSGGDSDSGEEAQDEARLPLAAERLSEEEEGDKQWDGAATAQHIETLTGGALTVAEEERRDAAAAIAGERVSLLAGAATQLGACAGSLLFAILVTDTNVFHQQEDTGL